MQTKRRILDSALQLYNELGISTVTSRHIAKDLCISAGNLHYHFKHTEDIIHELYQELVDEYDQRFLLWENITNIDNQSMSDFIRDSFEIVYKYRFIFLNVIELSNSINIFKSGYKELRLKREYQFKDICNKLTDAGYFKIRIPEHTLSIMLSQIFIISDFYLSYNQIGKDLEKDAALAEYSSLIIALFKPYL
jgi:AcrR family transcriptional regulator